jgi:predicted secreted protein
MSRFFFALLLLCLTPAVWAGSLIELSVVAVDSVQNDLARATMFSEARGASPKAVAEQINRQMGEANSIAKGYATVKSRSGSTTTYSSRDKSGIRRWEMRSELELESRDIAALSELIGKLQEKLGVERIQLIPAPETRQIAEDQAIQSALAAFHARAQRVAQTFGQPYQLKKIEIKTEHPGCSAVFAEHRAAYNMFTTPGESQIQVMVSGQIELAD